MSDSLHFGLSASLLTDLSANQYGLKVEQGEMPWAADPQLNLVDLPGRDGGHVYGSHYGTRRITIPVRVEGDDAADLRDKMDSIMWLLRSSRGNAYWKLDSLPDRLAYGRLGAGVVFRPSGPRLARGVLQVVCPSAFLLSTTETVQTVSVAASPKSFNVQAADAVEGTAPAAPVWVVKNTSGGTSSALTLENVTTAEKVSTSTGIANGAWLRFDADRMTIEKSVDSGANWTSFMAFRGTYKNIPLLVPGQVNSCVLTGLTAGSIEITYRARYL
jgi:phage-related protein